MSPVIEVSSVSKQYQITGAHTINPHSLAEAITRKIRYRLHTISPFHTPQLTNTPFLALDNVSFTIQQGEKVAIIGKNGSGKTTLLRILSRITMPTSGTVRIRGKLVSLLQAGTGFHPELSGRENIYMNGIILGMTKKEIAQKFEEIVDFSGIESFLDTPIKFYSTGMQARLGFSVAAHLRANIMLIDEGLASGDSDFRHRATAKIKSLSEEGHTILFVSHDEQIVRNICTRAMVLERGQLVIDTNDVHNIVL